MKPLLILALFSYSCHAQIVYKCSDAEGNPVFTQTPCAADAEVLDTSDAQKTASRTDVEHLSDYDAVGTLNDECRQKALAIGERFRRRRAPIESKMTVTRIKMTAATRNRQDSVRARLERTIGSMKEDLERNRRGEQRAVREHMKLCRALITNEQDRRLTEDEDVIESVAPQTPRTADDG